MIKIILLICLNIFISNVYNRKIYNIIYKKNNKNNLVFINVLKCKQKYHLNAKKFINFKEIQLQRIKEYRKRSGPEKNNINYNLKDKYNYHENFLFVRNEVLPTLAKIENEKLKEKEKYKLLFRDINDYNILFTRQTFLQFLIDLYNIFLKIDEAFIIHKKDFSSLVYMGPMQLTNYLYNDIIYISSLVDNSGDITVSQYGIEYIYHLEELCERNKLKFLAHSYVFYKNFHLSKEHLLNSICKYLNIFKKLKSSTYVSDVSNFEYCLNKVSRKWSRWEKDNFLSGLYDATDKMMILTKHFQQIKK
ncbi:heme oxygenase, putative [Plasmodium relictum]|uniref:Heme oxygenase, putative n=1 Tax=Plasmodium relictum TaxID=85471 RepID=A0A1J1H8B0_PLARL|nr:heme oxygenase, putative [Plasmodium relictum]CRG99672.1 heme oxygenase, putative [Plasmodium relictum]